MADESCGTPERFWRDQKLVNPGRQSFLAQLDELILNLIRDLEGVACVVPPVVAPHEPPFD